MTSFRLVSVATAALLFAQLHEVGVSGAKPPAPSPPQLPTSKSINCLPQMNAERADAGLAPFNPPKEAKLPTKGESVGKLCEAITKSQDAEMKNILLKAKEEDGTLAYYPAFQEQDVCADAVDFWKSFKFPSSFVEGPPAYKSDDESPYDTHQTRSLMALFSAQSNPTMECVYVECAYEPEKKEGPGKGAQAPQASPKPNEKPSVKSAREVVKDCKGERGCVAQAAGVFRSLVCVTTPPALVKGQVPYKQEQWEKVRKHVNSGKMYSITAATSFVLAASALWLSAF